MRLAALATGLGAPGAQVAGAFLFALGVGAGAAATCMWSEEEESESLSIAGAAHHCCAYEGFFLTWRTAAPPTSHPVLVSSWREGAGEGGAPGRGVESAAFVHW